MLRKLLKYEFKATARTFFPIYIAILLVSIVNRLIRLTSSEIAFALTVVILGGLFVALGVITIIAIVQRFRKNLLSSEGYLMFTLPVSSAKLILSKLIVATVWTVVSGIISILAFLILFSNQVSFLEIREFIVQLMQLLTNDLTAEKIGVIIEIPLIILFSYIGVILSIYFSIATAQLPVFNKHRGIMSFVSFFVSIAVIQWLGAIAVEMLSPILINQETLVMHIILFSNILVSGILFIATNFILKKHLNLE